MKRILLLQLTLLVSLLAQAADWLYPKDSTLLKGLSYYIADGNKSAKVKSHPTGKYAGAITIPDSIMVTITEGKEPVKLPVTEINGGAFEGCTELTEIRIPASVTKIWKNAFERCTGLTTVYMDNIEQACTTQYEQANANPLSAVKHLYINGKEVTDLTIPSTVTSIGQYAFANCEVIKSVTIPASVVKIGTDAFKGCKNLATSTFATVKSLCKMEFGSLDANPLYRTHEINADGHINITTLSIPKESIRDVGGKQGLGGYILAGATYLMNVTIPDGVKTIGPSAFKDCKGLKTVTFPSKEAVTSIDYADETANPLRYASTLIAGGEAVEELAIDQAEVGKNAFAYCKGLKRLKFEEGVVKIGENAFLNCTNLEKIELPLTLDSIGQSAFRGCQSLKDFEMPESLKGIGIEAFRDCKSLTTVTVPEGCELKFGVFRFCSNLETATLPASLNEISESMFENCSKLKNVEMRGQSRATQIGKKAFYYCSALEQFPQSDKLNFIDENAFAYCKSLKTLNLAEKGQLTIGNNAFEHCTGLTTLTLPSTLVTIGSNAFKGDSALTKVFCEATTAPGINVAAFGGKETGMTLYVPEDSTGYGSKLPWNNFKERVTIKETTLTFYLNDEEIGHITQKAGTAVCEDSIPKVPLSKGEAFMGWSADIPQTMPNDSMFFYGYKSINADIDGYNYTLYPAEVKNGENLQARATLMRIVKELNENETTIKLADQVSKGQTYPVTVIASKAFEKDSIISYLYLPSTLQSIEAEAFKGCRRLTAVYQFPSSITQIADGLFENCPALTSIFVGSESETKQSALPDGITKIGNSAFRGCGSLQLAKLPASLSEVGELAFRGSGFKKLVIPESVEILGIEAFRECGNLKEVEFKEGTRVKSLTGGVFQNCRSLEKVTLRGTTELGMRAFEGCSSLTNIFLPEGVSKIGPYAFSRCTALSNIVLPSTVEYIGTKVFEASGKIKQVTVQRNEAPFAVSDAFEDSVCQRAILYVPDTVNYKGQEPWSKFKNKVERKDYTQYFIKYYDDKKDDSHRLLADEEFAFFCGDTITIPVEKLKRADHKFQLKGLLDNDKVVEEDKVAELQMTMPARDIDVIVNYQQSEQELKAADSIRYKVFIMDNYAEVLKGYDSKENVKLDSVTYNGKSYPVKVIGANAFKDFKKLKSVTLPDSLTTIGDYAFCNTSLTSVTLPAKLDSIGTKAFDHCQQLKGITIPASVKRMGNEMFVWCTRLEDVTIEAAISTLPGRTLPGRTFQNCKNLKEIEIPSQIETIGEKAFEGCDQLSAVTLSDSLKQIGDGAFNGCSKIRSLIIPASVKTIGDNAFYNVFGNETNEDGEEVPDDIILKGKTLPLPTAQHTTFDEGAYDKAVLRTNIPAEKLAAPWDGFPVKTISEGTSTGTKPCETPVITYKGGKINVTCETPGAKIYCKVTVADNQNQTSEGKAEIALTKTYVVTAYAKKDGMSKSQTATHALTLDQGDVNGDGDVDTRDAIAILKKVVE